MSDKTEEYIGYMAEHVIEKWDTFGAPEDMDMAKLDIIGAAGDEVMRWTDDVAEVYAEELAASVGDGEGNPIRLGVRLEWRLAAELTSKLARMGALPRKPEPDVCPKCGSHDTESKGCYDGEANEGRIVIYRECPHCGIEYANVYRLTEQVPEDEY